VSLVHLPQAQADRLKALYSSGDRPALKAYIGALRAQGWPLRAIGEPLDLPRSTIQYFEKSADQTADTSSIPLSPKAIETAGTKTVRWRTHIPAEQRPMLRELADKAKRVRSTTPQDSELRQASDRLDSLIQHYLDRMVPVTEIAEAMGVTHRAVNARIERRNESD
jgi:DNA-binding transcriptional MerR regulator